MEDIPQLSRDKQQLRREALLHPELPTEQAVAYVIRHVYGVQPEQAARHLGVDDRRVDELANKAAELLAEDN